MEIHINTWGTSLRIIDGLLSVKWDKKVNQIPLGKIKCINLTKGISISSDVLYECLDQGIDIMISERSGYPLGRLWNNKFGSISNIRKKQMDFANGPDVVGWSIHNIQDKIDNQIDLLSCFLALDEPHESLITQTIQRLTINKNRLSDYKAMNHEEAFPKIRATEGQAAKLYFDCIVPHLPNRFQFVKRSKRPAKDITNSMLNYAYGMLYAHIESALIKAGLDPFIGIFHRNEYNRPVLTYDVI